MKIRPKGPCWFVAQALRPDLIVTAGGVCYARRCQAICSCDTPQSSSLVHVYMLKGKIGKHVVNNFLKLCIENCFKNKGFTWKTNITTITTPTLHHPDHSGSCKKTNSPKPAAVFPLRGALGVAVPGLACGAERAFA